MLTFPQTMFPKWLKHSYTLLSFVSVSQWDTRWRLRIQQRVSEDSAAAYGNNTEDLPVRNVRHTQVEQQLVSQVSGPALQSVPPPRLCHAERWPDTECPIWPQSVGRERAVSVSHMLGDWCIVLMFWHGCFFLCAGIAARRWTLIWGWIAVGYFYVDSITSVSWRNTFQLGETRTSWSNLNSWWVLSTYAPL